jgi:gliding motility-associated protein GldL
MKSIQRFFETMQGKRIKNLIIGVGAGIVMMGALFKIQHWPGAGYMLTAGLTTEALIFTLQGILPPHKDYYWEKLYPDLDVSPEIEADKGGVEAEQEKGSVTKQLDEMLEEANVETEAIQRLGKNLEQLDQNISQLSDMSDAANVTSEYSEKTREAAQSLEEMKNAYSEATKSASELSSASEGTKEYQEQIQAITKNLSSLNAMYESELQDTNNHLKTMNQFHDNLEAVMSNISDSVEDTKKYKEEVAQLSKNLTQLNTIYGNMLTAMSGPNSGQS